MDKISRLPGCDGQAADAVSADTQVKMEDAPKLLKIPKSECPDIWIRPPRHKWPKSWSSMEDPVVPLGRILYGSSFTRTVVGKAVWENPIAARFGEGFQLGMLIRTPWKKSCSYLCMWMTSNWLERGQNIDPMWKVLNKEVDLGERTSFLDHVYLRCTHRPCEISKDCWQLLNHVWITNFRGGNRKASILWESWYFFMVFWYGRSCEEMWGMILWVSKQGDSTTQQSIYSLHRWPPLQKRRLEIRGRSVKKKCWQIVSEMLILGTGWETWYTMVCEQNCTIHHKMDKSLLLRVESYIVRFWEVIHLFPTSWDMQENCSNFSFTQFNRIRNHFLGCRIEVGWYSRSWFMGFDRRSSWKHESEPYRTGRLVKEQTWSSFATPHDSQTQAISESDQWFG